MQTMILGTSPFESPSGTLFLHQVYQQMLSLSHTDIAKCDAIILWGGMDIHPSLYNQKPHAKNQAKQLESPPRRDFVEWHLMKEAHDRGIPIIGVCRGAQLLTVYAGGSLVQHVEGHNTSHTIVNKAGLSMYAPADHHQMMNPGEVNHELLAWTESLGDVYEGEPTASEAVDTGYNGLDKPIDPEIIWYPEIKGLAIQPHPEWGPQTSDFCKYVVQLLKDYVVKK